MLLARTRHVLDEELAGLTDDLLAAGCVRFDQLAAILPLITGWQREPDDDRLVTITGRRPVVESVLAAAAASTPGVTVHRGTGVTGLLTGTPAADGIPHVTGVRTAARRRTERRPRSSTPPAGRPGWPAGWPPSAPRR